MTELNLSSQINWVWAGFHCRSYISLVLFLAHRVDAVNRKPLVCDRCLYHCRAGDPASPLCLRWTITIRMPLEISSPCLHGEPIWLIVGQPGFIPAPTCRDQETEFTKTLSFHECDLSLVHHHPAAFLGVDR